MSRPGRRKRKETVEEEVVVNTMKRKNRIWYLEILDKQGNSTFKKKFIPVILKKDLFMI